MTTQAIISRPLNIVKQQRHAIFDSEEVIYVDHSILSTFALCNEKARLAYVEHHKSNKSALALDFGSCFHAGIQAYYEAIVTNKVQSEEAINLAEIGFIKEWQARGGSLPIQLEGDEKRSLERGIWLTKAYIARWKNEPYVNIINNKK